MSIHAPRDSKQQLSQECVDRPSVEPAPKRQSGRFDSPQMGSDQSFMDSVSGNPFKAEEMTAERRSTLAGYAQALLEWKPQQPPDDVQVIVNLDAVEVLAERIEELGLAE